MTKFTDHLWQDLVREHGPTLAKADHPEPSRVRRPRPRVLAGSTLGLLAVGVALVLALSGSATPPAFAVTPHRDGSVSVKIYRRSGIVGANRKLAALGIHERLYAVSGHFKSSGARTTTSGPLLATSTLPQSCLRDKQTGGVVHVLFPSKAAQQQQVGSGTYTATPGATGNTGGPPNNDTFTVIACQTEDTGNTGSGNTGNTGSPGPSGNTGNTGSAG